MEAVKLVSVFLASDSFSNDAFSLKYDKDKGIANVTAKAGGMFRTINPSSMWVGTPKLLRDDNGDILFDDRGQPLQYNGGVEVEIPEGKQQEPGAWKYYIYDQEGTKKYVPPTGHYTNLKDGKLTKDSKWVDTRFNISGTDGVDHIAGWRGDDTLIGGKGRDAMTGGAGKDVFGLYGMKKNAKFITDFVSGEDTLLLRADNKKFQRWQRQGSLFSVIAKKRQLTGDKDMIGYNQTNGKMFFYNGKTGVAKLMAQFAPGTQVSVNDIKLTIGEGGDKA